MWSFNGCCMSAGSLRWRFTHFGVVVMSVPNAHVVCQSGLYSLVVVKANAAIDSFTIHYTCVHWYKMQLTSLWPGSLHQNPIYLPFFLLHFPFWMHFHILYPSVVWLPIVRQVQLHLRLSLVTPQLPVAPLPPHFQYPPCYWHQFQILGFIPIPGWNQTGTVAIGLTTSNNQTALKPQFLG